MSTHGSPGHILITGASSGLGAALALAYAREGVRLSLAGRNAQRLEQIAQQANGDGAACSAKVVDVTDRDAMQDWVRSCDDDAPIDLVIANAGISSSTRKAAGSYTASDAEVFATNVDGVVHTVEPALVRMLQRGHGQIALMSSLASFRGFADAPAYCASKAAVRFYGNALRRAHQNDGIGVSVICPGFVRSPMTDANDFRMPMLMEADRAADLIRRRLAQNRRTIAFPLPMYIGVRLLALF